MDIALNERGAKTSRVHLENFSAAHDSPWGIEVGERDTHGCSDSQARQDFPQDRSQGFQQDSSQDTRQGAAQNCSGTWRRDTDCAAASVGGRGDCYAGGGSAAYLSRRAADDVGGSIYGFLGRGLEFGATVGTDAAAEHFFRFH